MSLGPKLALALALGLSACQSSDSLPLEAESPSDGPSDRMVGVGGAAGARRGESGIMLHNPNGPYARVIVDVAIPRGNQYAGFDLSTGEVVLVWGLGAGGGAGFVVTAQPGTNNPKSKAHGNDISEIGYPTAG
ncbi:MAG: hypothetical protein AAGA56_26865 [Myxococcota bacterium]